mmetsp:Transcript_22625/g.72809  ORF Transcript_22625/g.72809 Transcript_22625/m.72809 type:complete len:247 (-) Transcript_22625:44-784(-)
MMMMVVSLFLGGTVASAQKQTSLPAPVGAIELNSTEGFEILLRSSTRSYREVSIHLATQQTESLCAIASAVAVMNAMKIPAPVDPTYSPYAYWTQDLVTTDPCVTKIHDPNHGSTRDQVATMLGTCYPIAVQNVGAPPLDELRDLLTTALAEDRQQTHVLVNFERTDLDSEAGGGHFSPVVAIDTDDDLVLMLDVARYKYPPMWFKLEDLWKATLRLDSSSGEPRGFLIVQPAPLGGGNRNRNLAD